MRVHFTGVICPSVASTTSVYHKSFETECYFSSLPKPSANPSHGSASFTGPVLFGWQKMTEFSMPLRTWKTFGVWKPRRDGAALTQLPGCCMSLRASKTQSIGRPQTLHSPGSFPVSAITQAPAQTSNSLILRGCCCKCNKLFLSGPTGKSDCQKDFPKAGAKRKIVKAAMSQLENGKSGPTTNELR